MERVFDKVSHTAKNVRHLHRLQFSLDHAFVQSGTVEYRAQQTAKLADHVLELAHHAAVQIAVTSRPKVLEGDIDNVQGLAQIVTGGGNQLGFAAAFVLGGPVHQVQQLAVKKVGPVPVFGDPGADHSDDIGGHQKEYVDQRVGHGGAGP